MATEALSDSPGAGFDAFYRELHDGRVPYRWQVRAAVELTAGRLFQRPSERLTAPTGSGKTTLIECVLFALAWQATEEERTVPLRLFWVIDRRGVVDQVVAHAQAIAERLNGASDHATVTAVAKRLGRYGDGAAPAVQVQRWRGGIEREVADLLPGSAAVVCTTVDQVGSRLLFRGYGTSRRSRPIDAALVGTDSLIVLDEAHISAPFLSTARAVARFQERTEEETVRPLRVAAISATLTDSADPEFEPTPGELGEPGLARRLRARKRARLVRSSNRVRGLVDEARRLSRPGFVVGVVANTVLEARKVHSTLAEEAEPLLVIGPSRPLERDAALRRIPERGERQPQSDPLFVVATQTIEVGLDLDFDALVTAVAPFPSLVQRFGRLDRAGCIGESDAAVVGSREPCPVYGPAGDATLEWLEARAEDDIVDLGPEGVRDLARHAPPVPERGPVAPLLAPWHVEALAQTSDEPVPSPDVAPFLHGEAALETADVRLAWRADLVVDDEANWTERVRLRLPHSGELLSLGVGTARRWLADLASGGSTAAASEDLADIESVGPAVEPGAGPASYVLVPPRGPDGTQGPELNHSRSIRPGDVIVVPSSYGGCDEFGWAPDSDENVRDLGDLDPRRPRLLIDKESEPPPDLMTHAEELGDMLTADAIRTREAYAEIVPAAREWIGSRAAAASTEGGGAYSSALEKLAEGLGDRGEAEPVPSDEPAGLLLVPASQPSTPTHRARQTYEGHVQRVEELARSFAEATGLDPIFIETVAFAARYHDTGKLDIRFQAWLNGGSPGDPACPLAKSGRAPWIARARRERIAAGWPRGKRHEALSAALVAAVDPAALDVDRTLALHLVLTHHGQHRPFLPAELEPDSEPVEVSAEIEGERVVVGSDAEVSWVEHAERFCELNRRFGHWGLAAVEAALVLADRRASGEAES